MDIPFSRWYSAIEKRRSRRHFDINRPIEPDKLSALDTLCREFIPFHGARARLVTDSAKDVFRGIVGGYGKIKDAPAFIAFIGNMDSPSVQEEVGYTGEGVVIKSNERVLAVTPVGYARRLESLEEKLMTGFGRHHRRASLFPG